MNSAETRSEFADKVRALYLEVFGEDALKGTEDGEPVSLGALLVQIEADYLDGESGLITVYDGSYTTCKGMAWRFLNDDFRDDDDV